LYPLCCRPAVLEKMRFIHTVVDEVAPDFEPAHSRRTV
ncbi:hypothetical protein ABLO02_11725, partial [Mycobacterium tuberculosis]